MFSEDKENIVPLDYKKKPSGRFDTYDPFFSKEKENIGRVVCHIRDNINREETYETITKNHEVLEYIEDNYFKVAISRLYPHLTEIEVLKLNCFLRITLEASYDEIRECLHGTSYEEQEDVDYYFLFGAARVTNDYNRFFVYRKGIMAKTFTSIYVKEKYNDVLKKLDDRFLGGIDLLII